MNEEKIITWMRERIHTDKFTDAASLAGDFLREHNITDTLDPVFAQTIDAGFKVAEEIAEYRRQCFSSDSQRDREDNTSKDQSNF